MSVNNSLDDDRLSVHSSDSESSQNSVENGRQCIVRFRHCDFTFVRQILIDWGKRLSTSPIKGASPAKKICLDDDSNNELLTMTDVKANPIEERICGVLNLASLFRESFSDTPIDDLITVAFGIDLSHSRECAEQIEIESRQRRPDKESQWKQIQVGRICGSVFKEVCQSQSKCPPKQLMGRIYQEIECEDSSDIWMKKNYMTVRQKYERVMLNRHKNFIYRKCGLILAPDHPQFCVTPGGFVECDCCGRGITEFYAPYAIRNEKMIYSLPCIDETDDYDYDLRKDTSFYYKIQLHMFLTDTKYCDFVIWTLCDFLDIRVKRDDDFLFVKVNTAKTFFVRKVLPDLLSSGC